MRNADTMTPEELRELAEQKEQQTVSWNTVIKRGELKHDIYRVNADNIHLSDYYMLSKKEKNQLISRIFVLTLPAGSPFECYRIDGEESWFDCDGWIEEYGNDWAEENLINIQEEE